jgi:hypothetical protein
MDSGASLVVLAGEKVVAIKVKRAQAGVREHIGKLAGKMGKQGKQRGLR